MFPVYFTFFCTATGNVKYNKKLYSINPLLMAFPARFIYSETTTFKRKIAGDVYYEEKQEEW